MTRMNRKLEYALMALRLMSQNETRQISAKEVSQQLGTPYDVTARVMQTLSGGGLLKAEYGSNGGYLLAQPLHSIAMSQLIEVIEGPTELTRCLSKNDKCEIKRSCNIITPIEKLNFKLQEFYSKISVQDLFQDDFMQNLKIESTIEKSKDLSHV